MGYRYAILNGWYAEVFVGKIAHAKGYPMEKKGRLAFYKTGVSIKKNIKKNRQTNDRQEQVFQSETEIKSR